MPTCSKPSKYCVETTFSIFRWGSIFQLFFEPFFDLLLALFGSTFGPEHTTRHSRGARGTFQSITWPETFQDLHNILQALLNILQALPSNGLLVAIQLYKMVVQAAKILNYWIPLFGNTFDQKRTKPPRATLKASH